MTNNSTWAIETEFLLRRVSQIFSQRIRHATFKKLFKSAFASKSFNTVIHNFPADNFVQAQVMFLVVICRPVAMSIGLEQVESENRGNTLC